MLMQKQENNNDGEVPISDEVMSRLMHRHRKQNITINTLIENLLDETEEHIPVEELLQTLLDSFESVGAIEAHVQSSGFTLLTVKSGEVELKQGVDILDTGREKLLVTRDDGSEFTAQFMVSTDPYGIAPDVATIAYCEDYSDIGPVSVEQGAERIRTEIIEVMAEDD